MKPAVGRSAAGRFNLRHASAAQTADHFLAGIPTLWLAIFFLAPLGFTVVFSFGRSTFGGVALDFTFANYATALSGFYGAAFLRTLVFAATASGLCLLVAFPAAYFIYAYLPIAVVPLVVVLDRIPKGLTEASRDLGATRWETFLLVTLPLSRPGIASAIMLTAVPMLGEMVIPKLLGGSRGVLMGQALSSQYLQAQNYPLGSAMAVLVLLGVAVIVGLLAWVTKGFAEVGR
ncbi:MAG: ABC transporter permease subunit [Burkholderia sp.]|nr:ABC transporter permease subunit [Burkholderia sp.]